MLKVSEGNLLKSLSGIFRRMNSSYRITLVNEESMQESLTVHLTKKSLFVLVSGLFVGLFLLFSLLIFFTPLKYYVPGNNQGSISREKMIALQRTADSLLLMNRHQEQFIFNLLNVANGKVATEPRDTQPLSKTAIQQASLQNAGQIDRASRYAYLKNQVADSNVDKSVYKKDSLGDKK